ncbi:MAG: hypothetical protein A2945_04360 [Candidatus Liptonbacteria bacterium RIFCSPLOWO2_01_FULL_52_25]|uniref:SCP domain-containing protein n=1 Tax=Candidatus Liptonbacteria bacterium RIFCSPLOWO2_01_FULL_52_25 TaxID=1798650 RepID=A0A1G2CFQ2_9BACT|nr:MAG: hypothetical protein A2945_04360 [Candidatus Liptonbacteria bacterium RIFCSPLOWO2_01_FULL_52_25]
MKKLKLASFTLLLVVFVMGFVYRDALLGFLAPQFRNFEDKILDIAIQEIKKEISAPTPLRIFETPSKEIALTVAGVVQWTNAERATAGLAPLAGNAELNAAAKIRLDDMFQHQYFAHESPSGKDAEYVADASGYEFISLGENLALGVFEGDQDVVIAWMNSQGHRANILKDDFEEIGVAVGKNAFEKEQTWIAVQVFARPASSCPDMPATIKAEINVRQADLKRLQQELVALKAELEDMPRGKERNEKVDAYNALVGEYNALGATLKPLVAEYNAQATAYNTCIGK